jgi:hypothetical protein
MFKKIARKNLTKKTFEWPKMSHIFISPYHNHFWVAFNLFFKNVHQRIFLNAYSSDELFNSLITI